MKIRSKELFLYLLNRNIDFKDQEALANAKADYRRLYKKRWKTKAKKNKEIRPTFTEYEYQELCKRAELLGMVPTTYVRRLILSQQENHELVPNKQTLLKVLQLLSMTVIQARRENFQSDSLVQAEQYLLTYIKTY